MMPRPTYYEARRYLAKEKRKTKIKITAANTTQPGIASGAGAVKYHNLPFAQRMALLDYLDELRQQAKWDAEKCAKQQSKNI